MALLLTEGQMSDHKGAALLLPLCRRHVNYSATAATTATASGRP